MKVISSLFATVLTASLLVLGSAGSASAAPPACYGEYKPGVECTTGTLRTGEYFGTALGCDNAGRAYVRDVRVETAQGTTVGWYTWECQNFDGQWLLILRGMVEK